MSEVTEAFTALRGWTDHLEKVVDGMERGAEAAFARADAQTVPQRTPVGDDVFAHLIDALIGREGGYVNHPNDRGGETNWGITVAVARRNGYTGPMRSMPRSEAVRIYRAIYWDAPDIGAVAKQSVPIAEELFDTGVNIGVSWPGQFLQIALNALNRQGKDYPDILEDGDIGNATLEALDAYLRIRGQEGEVVMLKALNVLQGARYLSLSKARGANESFTYGWLRTRVELPR